MHIPYKSISPSLTAHTSNSIVVVPIVVVPIVVVEIAVVRIEYPRIVSIVKINRRRPLQSINTLFKSRKKIIGFKPNLILLRLCNFVKQRGFPWEIFCTLKLSLNNLILASDLLFFNIFFSPIQPILNLNCDFMKYF